jgi:hypothetical protein
VSVPVHVAGLQQGSAIPPHATHDPPRHRSDVPHDPSEQHDWPAPPQDAHCPLSQTTLAAVHPIAQQACPAAPHPPQLPLVHVAASVKAQMEPEPAQRPATQQPMVRHVLAPQHTSPGLPHPVQIPASPTHRSPPVHWRPAQQLCPLPPHDRHVPLTHEPPAMHVPSLQQAPRRGPQVGAASAPSAAALSRGVPVSPPSRASALASVGCPLSVAALVSDVPSVVES